MASNLKSGSPNRPPRPLVYVPMQQRYEPRMILLARTTHGQRITGQIRAVVASINANLPIVAARTLSDQSSPILTQLRISASVAGSVGVVGMLLAAFGIYGVTAYAVARRTREIGIRMALGARSADVIGMVLRQGMALVGLGSAVGLMLGIGAGKLLAAWLLGIPAIDLVTFAGAVMLLASIGLVACYVPVRRATQIDAMEALRYE